MYLRRQTGVKIEDAKEDREWPTLKLAGFCLSRVGLVAAVLAAGRPEVLAALAAEGGLVTVTTQDHLVTSLKECNGNDQTS